MALTPISGEITAQPLNDNFSYLNERKNDLGINVKDYGAKGDGVTDDTSAIQNAIAAAAALGVDNKGSVVFFPSGVYNISSSLTVLGSQFVSFLGVGKPSSLSWVGTDYNPILSYDDGSDGMQISIEKLRFVRGNDAIGTIGIEFCKTPGNAVVNVTIAKNLFESLDTAVKTWTETDQLTFRENYVLGYQSYGLLALNGTNSNYHIRDNHFRAGLTGSWAIKHDGGANINIDGNTIQSASVDMRGIELSNVGEFRITSSYFEVASVVTTTGGPFVSIINSVAGTIENNHTTGNTGLSIIKIDGTSKAIKIGVNNHAISGGTPTRFIDVLDGAVGIIIIGKQEIANGAFKIYDGVVDFYIGDIITSTKPIAQYNGQKNVSSLATLSFFTILPDTCYFVIVKSTTDDAYCMGIIDKQRLSSASVFTINASQTYLTISASGDDLQVTNGKTATRAIAYSAFKMF